MNRARRQSLIATLLGLLLVTGVLAGLTAAGTAPPPPAPVLVKGEGELPAATGARMARLKQAVPGYGGMAKDGPGAASDDAFQARAYPGETISLQKLEAAEAAYKSIKRRPFPRGKNRTGTWVTVGPSRALYPFTPLRNNTNYVPNEYVAGGRTTALALAPVCRPGNCRMWITPAGGGIWRTNNALASKPKWRYLGYPLGINAAGAVTVDPNDRRGNTIYLGTGEANTCGSGCVAGVGLYKSTNGGRTWTGPLGRDVLSGKGIGQIVVKPGAPNTMYVGTTTALRGHSSVCCSGATRPVPGAAKWGLYKSTNGGRTWRFIHNGTANAAQCTGDNTEYANNGLCSPRGVRHVQLDPSDARTLYASSYARGIWRSRDEGRTWTQVKESLNRTLPQTRAAFAVTKLANGRTRMYVHEGNIGTPYSRLFRSDDVNGTAPAVFRDLTSANPADSGYATYNQCTGQCWYDLFVHTPKGHPDVVYTGGSYVYGETGGISNGRGVVLSTDAGVSGTDMTMDGTDARHPNGLHPDQHDMVTVPGKPFQFIEANDGGVMRSSGRFTDASRFCDGRTFTGPTAAVQLARCKQLLSRVPSRLTGINDGLTTLQFQSLSVNPRNVENLQGGTQDNGTWETRGNTRTWPNTMIGDGGQSGFDATRDEFRFHTFFDATPEVNFNRGDTASWISVYDGIFGIPGTQFYAPVISDPVVSGTMFAGTGRTVHRTKTHGLGNRTLEEANRECNSWTGTFPAGRPCGDWVDLGVTPLTGAGWGDREGGAVAAVERTTANRSTAWAATTTGRVFVTGNVDAEPAAAVRWTRLDDKVFNDPNRFVSSIYVDQRNPNRAWISYSGFNATTPATPGHVFEVTYDPRTNRATWRDRSYDMRDLPVTDLVRDDRTGDLYASSDFGVMRLAGRTRTWTRAAPGLPNVEVAGLTIRPTERVLYAATHGLGAWRLNLSR